MHEFEPLKRSYLESQLGVEYKNLTSICIDPFFFMILIGNLDLTCLTKRLNQTIYKTFLLQRYKILHEKTHKVPKIYK